MKIVRIEPRTPSSKKLIRLFDTAEALYVYLQEGIPESEIEECITLSITGDEFIEAEWLGCEFVYDGDSHVRLDSVRVGRSAPTENSSGAIVETYTGWVHASDVMFDDGVDAEAEFTRLSTRDECTVDFPFLFGDDLGDEEAAPEGP